MIDTIDCIIKEHWKKISKKANVIGFSGKLQPKIKAGKVFKNNLVFRVYVSSKTSAACLKAKDLIPRELKIKNCAVTYIETDVVDIGYIKALSNKEHKRPVQGGTSSMHKDGTACTTNGFFKDNETDLTLVASNNHCYSLENKAHVGDLILQPSPKDGGSVSNDVIGLFFKAVELKFSSFKCPYRSLAIKALRTIVPMNEVNTVDIAFATLTVPYENVATYLGAYNGKIDFIVGDTVSKSGRTTDQTSGIIVDTNWVGSVDYDRGKGDFQDCYLANMHCEGGDSGSPVFKDNKYGGALFAGSDQYSIICKVGNIEREGNVTLITEDSE